MAWQEYKRRRRLGGRGRSVGVRLLGREGGMVFRLGVDVPIAAGGVRVQWDVEKALVALSQPGDHLQAKESGKGVARHVSARGTLSALGKAAAIVDLPWSVDKGGRVIVDCSDLPDAPTR